MWLHEPTAFGAALAPAGCPPRLSQAAAPLTRAVEVINEFGQRRTMHIPAERGLTVYVDKRELVTLMTLGAHPEWLVLGYLRNQRLLDGPEQVESITVDWDVGAAAVRTRGGVTGWAERTAQRIVTTGCGQGSMFGSLMEQLASVRVQAAEPLRQSQLYAILRTVREQDSVYKQAGSVHGCALFRGEELLLFVEDVGRHNAVDTIAGWTWLQGEQVLRGDDKVFYTTGRLTSEMIIKAAQMGIPVVVSRSGITQMGLEVAQQVGVCAIGRATHTRFLCYTHPHRLVWDTPLS
ncbi:formate dehydrogenase accessory sulfurtransferase FdhD [Tepidimonas aquatica]|uniref:Sulfur carrier protein FdhD n=1 Tax=Tepidimonas aquatica TaxID=247482 RepID=A0A554WP93_9BURK|nr:formate dehydrogenase accessory sulfurtransferase FdhD [Tepidimonas aquatica]TSE25400.1 Sulfurtransferase FdhD [Tepidimonas aquatica]